ncbi:hypothetical protein ABB37_05897 [Leptomonas pyrrhocoris]|uniref:Uncharacterized protein n=1 Tax=Leptomonas pyrrhocoris TaxID=157538 RepID=A0A0N0DUF7_LEPPY|nr:hypothetical protein ABB37_05897 [Leptomonas pyrrhocoris]KPA78798.1 hypothetical protein ABB37_05897 [Leptomonas pyrrhocoris]|eukprot:XP_015657237.1 hypothetical protein ABB37_05897 [Leptomonas pyrrhocoris]
MGYSPDIPYLIWAAVCVIVIVVIIIFSIMQIKKYFQQSRDNGASTMVDVTVLPATVLVNSVSDTNTATQYTAALAAVGDDYAYAAVQPSSQEQHAWYVSNHMYTTHRREGQQLPHSATNAAGNTAEAAPPSSSAAQPTFTQRVRGEGGEHEEEGGDDDGSPLGANPLRPINDHGDTERYVASTVRGMSSVAASPPALDARYFDALHTFVSQQSSLASPPRLPASLPVAANPVPLGASHMNPLSPLSLRPNEGNGQAATTTAAAAIVAPSTAEGHGSDLPHSSVTPPHPSSPLRFALLWVRDRQRGRSDVRNSEVPTEVVAEVVDGYCCDEQGRRLTVQQAEELYGGAVYLPRASSLVMLLADDEDDGDGDNGGDDDAKSERSSGSVFSLYQLTPEASDEVKQHVVS